MRAGASLLYHASGRPRWLTVREYVASHRKAVVAFLAPGVGIVTAALIAGEPITRPLVVAALATCVGTSLGVGATKNRD